MKVVVWNKEDIKNITLNEKEMWFDTYNNDLFEDRGYDVMLMDIEEIEKLYIQFKNDYFEYLESLENNDEFICYVIMQDEYDKFISQARIMYKENKYYIEGLETHRDFLRKGHATKLLNHLEKEAVKRGITALYGNSYIKNFPSINTLKKAGFIEIPCEVETTFCMKKEL